VSGADDSDRAPARPRSGRDTARAATSPIRPRYALAWPFARGLVLTLPLSGRSKTTAKPAPPFLPLRPANGGRLHRRR
jgi:hypothetical protein